MKYYPFVSYTYIVDSTVYTSDRIGNMNYNTKNRSVVEEALKKYPLDLREKGLLQQYGSFQVTP